MCAEREREMGSRKKDQTAPHQPLLSSLVVRPTDSGGGGAGSDYEPGEVRRHPPPYLRSNRYDGHGYKMRPGSVSPVLGRGAHHRFSPGFESSGGASRSRGLGNGKEPGRYRDYSPPYGRGRDVGRFLGRDHDQSARGPGPFKVEGLPRNNPNVRPREGDWICSDPFCKNLNFARREQCNNCNKPRYILSPRRGYPMFPFAPRQRVLPPLDHSPGRIMNGRYRSPPHGWPRDAPRDFRAAAGPLTRHEVRFPDPLLRHDYPEDDHPRDRYRYDRPVLPDWGHRDHRRDTYFNERRGHRRRMLSPPPEAVPSRGCVSVSHIRDRSRSPVRGGGEEPKDYQRDMYMNRRRDDRRGVGMHCSQ